MKVISPSEARATERARKDIHRSSQGCCYESAEVVQKRVRNRERRVRFLEKYGRRITDSALPSPPCSVLRNDLCDEMADAPRARMQAEKRGCPKVSETIGPKHRSLVELRRPIPFRAFR